MRHMFLAIAFLFSLFALCVLQFILRTFFAGRCFFLFILWSFLPCHSPASFSDSIFHISLFAAAPTASTQTQRDSHTHEHAQLLCLCFCFCLCHSINENKMCVPDDDDVPVRETERERERASKVQLKDTTTSRHKNAECVFATDTKRCLCGTHMK